ncbi:response regulator [candidate division KSB1 bacterium]|nr:response regulator [candidate division KSB1 bacterium]
MQQPAQVKPAILVVEDNPDQAFYLRYLLKNNGYSVDWCQTKDSCLRTARNQVYDLILLDIMLADEEDGFDLCRLFKNDAKLRTIPIIMLTARSDVRDRVNGLNLGADDYVVKPYNGEELCSRIKAVMKRKIYHDLASRYRELIENNTDLVLFLNNQGQIEHANRRAESVLPHLVATDHQLDFTELFSENSGKEISSALYQAIAGNQINSNGWILNETGDEQVIVDAQLIPLRHGDRIIGLGCILRDTSDQARVFHHLERKTQALKEKIEAQNAELNDMQQRLVLSEKLAVMGQLAAGVAHEFRNPLHIIRSSLYVLQKLSDLRKAKVREHLQIIDHEIARAERIIANLLDYAKKSPQRSAIQLEPVLEQTLELMDKELRLQKIRIVRNYRKVQPCRISSDDFKQIFLNLILNARDAMPNGGELRVAIGMENKNRVVFTLQDTGIGIPLEVQNKIFEPFFTDKVDGGGVGIGLSIVQSAVQRNMGEISVTSKPGLGTTFTIRLPAYSQDDPSAFVA